MVINKKVLTRIGFMAVYVGLGGFFVYQGVQAQIQTTSANEHLITQQQAVKVANDDLSRLDVKRTSVKNVDLNTFDKKALELALLMYNSTFINESELQTFKNKVSEYVTPSVLEQLSNERTPTVWNKSIKFPEYSVTSLGRMQVDKNMVTYLVTLTPKDKNGLKRVITLQYDMTSGLVNELQSEREYNSNANE